MCMVKCIYLPCLAFCKSKALSFYLQAFDTVTASVLHQAYHKHNDLQL